MRCLKRLTVALLVFCLSVGMLAGVSVSAEVAEPVPAIDDDFKSAEGTFSKTAAHTDNLVTETQGASVVGEEYKDALHIKRNNSQEGSLVYRCENLTDFDILLLTHPQGSYKKCIRVYVSTAPADTAVSEIDNWQPLTEERGTYETFDNDKISSLWWIDVKKPDYYTSHMIPRVPMPVGVNFLKITYLPSGDGNDGWKYRIGRVKLYNTKQNLTGSYTDDLNGYGKMYDYSDGWKLATLGENDAPTGYLYQPVLMRMGVLNYDDGYNVPEESQYIVYQCRNLKSFDVSYIVHPWCNVTDAVRIYISQDPIGTPAGAINWKPIAEGDGDKYLDPKASSETFDGFQAALVESVKHKLGSLTPKQKLPAGVNYLKVELINYKNQTKDDYEKDWFRYLGPVTLTSSDDTEEFSASVTQNPVWSNDVISGTAAVHVKSTADEEQPVFAAAAIYNQDGDLLYVQTKKVSLPAGETDIVFENIEVQGATGDSYPGKVFLWREDNIQPLISNSALELSF